MTLPVATIDSLAFGGNGVCRIDGKVHFVPYSCPGDKVALQITHHKKSYGSASISEIISPSPLRAVPACQIFGMCGGCCWQHIDYATQLLHKRTILQQALWRGGRIPAEAVEDVVAAPRSYGYRSRIQFKVSCRNSSLQIGFYRQASHFVEDAVSGCPIAVPEINKVMQALRPTLQEYPDVDSVVQLSFDAGDNGVFVVLHQRSPLTAYARRFFADRAGLHTDCAGFFVKAESGQHAEKLWGSSAVEYHMPSAVQDQKPVLLTHPPGGFAQVNRQQNHAMLSVIRRLGDFSISDSVLDLYCGNGNFSLPLACQVASVVGVEGNKESVRAADYNKNFNNISNSHFFCDDVETALSRLAAQRERFDVVLLDPPRAGAVNAVPGIARLKPKKIIYVSCDPNTLARDCGLFSSAGYRFVRTVPIDMFSHTYHLESVTLFVREKGEL